MTSARVVAVQNELALENLALAAHTAHGTGEDPAKAIASHADRIGHVQIADCPGRNFPGSGSLDSAALLGQLDASTPPVRGGGACGRRERY